MKIEWDVAITMDDGAVVRADIFRPADDDRHPVVLAYGPYAKGLNFAEGYLFAFTFIPNVAFQHGF